MNAFMIREALQLSSMMYTHDGLTCAVMPCPALSAPPCLLCPVCPALHSQPAEAAVSAAVFTFPSQMSSHYRHEKQGTNGNTHQLCLTYRGNRVATSKCFGCVHSGKLVMTVHA